MPSSLPVKMEQQRKRRAAKRAKLLYAHPRCVICNDPIILKSGRNHRAKTCGKRVCSYTRSNWLRA